MRNEVIYEVWVNGKFYYSTHSKRLAIEKRDSMPKHCHAIVKKVEIIRTMKEKGILL